MKLSIRGGVRAPRENKGRQTAGKDKGPTCQTSPEKKYLLCHPHAHRLNPDGYSRMHSWAKSVHGQKGK